MDQVYKAIYTGIAGSPPVPRARPAIIIPVAMKRCERITLFSQGFITRITVRQTGGVPVAADIDLFDSKVVFAAGDHPVLALPGDDPELYKVIPSQNIPAGVPLEVINQQDGFPFLNQDGTYADNQRYLYLLINPTGAAGVTTWDVSLTTRRNMD